MTTAIAQPKQRKQKTFESVALGPEPALSPTYTQGELCRALNWYNYEIDKDKAARWIREYAKTRFSADQTASLVKNAGKIPNTLIALARMVSIGSPVAPVKGDHLFAELSKLLAAGDLLNDAGPPDLIIDEDAAAPLVSNPPVASNPKRAARHSETAIVYVDGLFTRSFFERVDTAGIYEKLLGMGLKSAAYLTEEYELTLSDLKGFEKDPQLQEAYGRFSKPERARAIKFLEGLFEEVSKFNILKKANRKPRAVKAPSTEKLVKSVRYRVEADPSTGLKSMPPSKAIGSAFLGLYNAKTRVLSCYVGEKLSFKGSSVVGFDEAKSFARKIRKPQEIAANFATGTQKKAERWFADLKTVAFKPNGRINSDSLFIRVSF